MQSHFKFERAWSDFTGAGWNCRWAGSGIERSDLVRLWAVERGSEHPRERGAEILTAQLRSHALCLAHKTFSCFADTVCFYLLIVLSFLSILRCVYKAKPYPEFHHAHIHCWIKPNFKTIDQLQFFPFFQSASILQGPAEINSRAFLLFYGNHWAANDRTHSVKSEMIYVEDNVLWAAQIQMYGLILRLLPSPFKQKKSPSGSTCKNPWRV